MGALSKRDAENTLNRYENVIAFDEMDDENTEDWGLNDPPYLMMARVAEMWISGELKQGTKKIFKKNFFDHLFLFSSQNSIYMQAEIHKEQVICIIKLQNQQWHP